MIKNLSLVFFIFFLQGCDYTLTGETGKKPWFGHAYNNQKQKQEHWFTSYETRDWCMSNVKYDLEKTGMYTTSWLGYSKPYNCSFSSNSFLKSIYHYYFTVDKNHYQCIWMTYDPSRIKENQKYVYLLKGDTYRAGKCVWK